MQFGLLSYKCSEESEYIQKSIALVNEIKKKNKSEIDEMFFGNPPGKKKLLTAINRIFENIKSLNLSWAT